MDSTFRAQMIRKRDEREQRELRGRRSEQNPVVDAAIWREIGTMPSAQLRAGEFARRRLAAYEFELDDYELLAGRVRIHAPNEPEWRKAAEFCAGFPLAPGQTGHCELDLELLMAEGLDGVSARVRALRQKTADATAGEFYLSCEASLEGMRFFIEHAADAVAAKMPAASPERREELQTLLRVCRNISHRAPADFYEAIQLLWLAIQCVMSGCRVYLVCPGHLDRLLAPFADTVDAERGIELIEGLYFQINAYEPGGLAYGVMVGGRDADGRDVTNPVSYWALEAMRRTRLVYPTVGICRHAGTPDALVDLGIELIADGVSNVAFFGDETITDGLKRRGVPEAEACRYQNSTCVEITPSGASNIWVASPYFSLCGILLELLHQAVGRGRQFADFDAFLTAYRELLGRKIAEGVAQQNQWRRERREYGRKPLQSVFTRDCLARGRDIDDGGAVYNWVECSFVGLATLVASLVVIDREVFRDKRLTLAALDAILERNFADAEDLRQKFLRHYPKYGNAEPEVDALIPPLVEFLKQECARYRMEPDDAPFVPGTFCWIMHQLLGADCGATPDGRTAGFPFADGGGPAQGREHGGPTRAALSASSWEQGDLLGGFAFNMKFSKELVSSPEGKLALKAVVLTFLDRGGFETQINVLDTGVLERALREPEAFHDLVVRIGGYTDYFTRLSDAMKQEVLMRTEYTRF